MLRILYYKFIIDKVTLYLPFFFLFYKAVEHDISRCAARKKALIERTDRRRKKEKLFTFKGKKLVKFFNYRFSGRFYHDK